MARKYGYKIFPETIKGRVLLAVIFLGGLLVIGGYLAVLILSVELSLDAGGDIRPGEAKLVFLNRTDSVFCYDDGRIYDRSSGSVISLSPSATRAGESCRDSVKPNGTTMWYVGCYSDPEPGYTKGIPVDVLLSVEGSSPVYSESARCDEETTFVIAWLEGRFVVEKTVTQALPDQPPSH